jgi:hypothetical protein
VCAGIILAATDPGGGQNRLARSLADLAADIAAGFSRMLAIAGPGMPDTQAERRELLRRVIGLDPVIDQALGESSHLRYRSATLQAAVHGLLGSAGGLARRCDAAETLVGRRDRDGGRIYPGQHPTRATTGVGIRLARTLDGRSNAAAPSLRGGWPNLAHPAGRYAIAAAAAV